MATVHDVAAAVIERLGSMTAMKLEKLVYYCQGWHLARHGSSIFDETIEAWRQGPVVPVLYKQHRRRYNVDSWPLGSSANLTKSELASVEWVVAEYGPFSAIELSRMTHNELPWRAARGPLPESAASDAAISVDIMRDYYSRQIAEPEAAVTLASASAALEGVEFDEDWENHLRDVAAGLVSPEDLIAREISRITGA
ncbi:Panacea domain-containing protein [Micromonospora sp. NPDC048830]|uniref:Panacea domain-containing protein n=1 Tax=Micromonospora sp. NPDC048830 TaxID=3364257 RepID=UPI0037245846